MTNISLNALCLIPWPSRINSIRPTFKISFEVQRRLSILSQGSKLSVKLQESDGLVSTENLGVHPGIWESPKLSKLKQKKNLCDHNFDKFINLHTTYTSQTFSYYLTCVLSKKGSAVSVS